MGTNTLRDLLVHIMDHKIGANIHNSIDSNVLSCYNLYVMLPGWNHSDELTEIAEGFCMIKRTIAGDKKEMFFVLPIDKIQMIEFNNDTFKRKQ